MFVALLPFLPSLVSSIGLFVPSNGEENISVSADNVIVAVNHESFIGTLLDTNVFGTTGISILNFTTSGVVTVRNPSTRAATFNYEVFALNYKCNEIKIVVNPHDGYNWKVSTRYETRNVTMDMYQSYCFWFVWNPQYTYSLTMKSNDLDFDDVLQYTFDPSSTYYHTVNGKEQYTLTSTSSLGIIFKTDFGFTSGYAQFDLKTSDVIEEPQYEPGSHTMVCLKTRYDSCEWRMYYDWPIIVHGLPPTTIAIIVGLVVALVIIVVVIFFCLAYFCGYAFCCATVPCCIAITSHSKKYSNVNPALLSEPLSVINDQQATDGYSKYTPSPEYPQQMPSQNPYGA